MTHIIKTARNTAGLSLVNVSPMNYYKIYGIPPNEHAVCTAFRAVDIFVTLWCVFYQFVRYSNKLKEVFYTLHLEINKWYLLRHVVQEKCCILDRLATKLCLIHQILIWITIIEDTHRSDIIYQKIASIFHRLYPVSITLWTGHIAFHENAKFDSSVTFSEFLVKRQHDNLPKEAIGELGNFLGDVGQTKRCE